MPLEGFVCPPGSDTPGERHKPTYCVGDPENPTAPRCKRPCMAPGLLLTIYEAESTNYHAGHYISASLLSGSNCPRKVVYERTEPYYEQAIRKYWSFRGTHAHTIIERGEARLRPLGWLQEMRMSVPVTYADEPTPIFDADGRWTGAYDEDVPLTITMRGTCDLYNPTEYPYPLWDMKTMADKKVDMMVRGKKGGTYNQHIDDKWFWQLQIYRWLIAKTKIPPDIKQELGLKGVRYPEPKWVGIQGIAMMYAPRTGMACEVKEPYGGTGIYEIEDIPIIPLKKVEAFIRPRLLQWYKWLVLGQLPPVVPEHMGKWMCSGCCFNGEKIPGERCMPTAERRRGNVVDESDLQQ